MELEKPEIHINAYDVLANQIVGMSLEYGEIDVNKVWETIKRCYPYKDMKYEEFIRILEFLDSIKIIRFDKENNKIIKTRKGHRYFLENISLIPDEKSYDVIDIATNTKIGSLHEEFVAKHGNVGTIFILRGLPWKIEKVSNNKIYVSLENDFESAIPSWEGELLPVPFEIAQRAQEIKKELIKKLDELRGQELFFIPDKNKIFIENYKDWFIIHAPFGNRVNDSISRILSLIISEKYGIVVGIKTDPYRIMLRAGYIDSKKIKEILEEIDPNEVEGILKEALYNTDLFLWKFTHVSKAFGVIRKDADYSKSLLRRIAENLQNSPIFDETIRTLFVEKMDIENTKRVFEKIKNGEIKIEIIERNELSPLGIVGLEEYVSDVLISEKWREILRLVKDRLENTELILVCMNCNSEYRVKVKDYDENMKCSVCGGNYFGVAKSERDVLDKEKLYITADLLKYYGKKFLFVYAGRGISYISAVAILKKKIEDETELLKEIIEYEKRGIKFAKDYRR